MINIIIETMRLVLRPFNETDAESVSHNSKQPVEAHFLSDMVFEVAEKARGWIAWIQTKYDEREPNIVLAIERKSDQKVIGLIGVAPKKEIGNEVEILFSISDEYQNNGYATEAGKAIIWWAFEQAGQDVLSAIVKPENKASRRVIEKLGFIYCDTRILPYDGRDCDFDYFRLYHIDHLPGPEWDTHNLYTAEYMDDFFNVRAEGYNDYMLSGGGEERYRQLGSFIPKTEAAIHILDLGCGTGLELGYIWENAPNAHITCVDLSHDMLELLLKNHSKRLDQITVVQASYFEWPYPTDAFEIALSCQTMHHFWPEQKATVYRSILKALKPGGCYIESDFYVEATCAEQYSKRYATIIPDVCDQNEAGKYHIDIPCTIDLQRQLLLNSGFETVVVLESHIRPRWSGGILRAVKPKSRAVYNK